jgi:hypothetical protein
MESRHRRETLHPSKTTFSKLTRVVNTTNMEP